MTAPDREREANELWGPMLCASVIGCVVDGWPGAFWWAFWCGVTLAALAFVPGIVSRTQRVQ